MPDEKAPSSGASLRASLMHFCSGKPMHFCSGVDTLIIFLEIKDFKRPGIHRQDKGELLQDVGSVGMVGLRFQRRFSGNYFQTTFQSLAARRPGEGGLNSYALSGRGPCGRPAQIPAKFRNLFSQGQPRQQLAGGHGGGLRSKTSRNSGWGG
jgi:hypothetical protein